VHENIFCPQQKEKKTKNIETHDFSTPTEWNVEMVNDKVIVTLSGEDKKKIHFYSTISTWEEKMGARQARASALRSCQLRVWD